MTLARIKTWIAGEVLTASDLNAEINNILNNPSSLISPLTLTGTLTMSNAAVNESQGGTIASAATTDIGAATGNYVVVSGTTTITGFGTAQAGARRTVEFSGKLKITYNASTMILPGALDYYTAAGDVLEFISEGSGAWRCVTVTPALGVATPYAGCKNQLLNGGFEVWQRGAGGSASIAVSANTNTQVADGWFFFNAGCTSTVSQQAGLTNGSQWSCKVQRNAGQTGTNLDRLEHTFWLDKMIPLRGVVVTLSFVAKCGADYSSTSSLLSLQLCCGTGSAQKRQSTAYTSETTPINSTSIVLTTTATRYVVISTVVVPTTTTQMAFQFVRSPVGTASTDDSFTVDDVQIEIGGAPTAFDRKPFYVELAECQYLYRKTFPYATAPAQNAGNTGAVVVYTGTGVTGVVGATVSYQPMRIAPTVTSYNPGAANANVRDTTNSADRTITVDTASDNSFPFSFAASVAGATNRVHFAMDASI